MSLRLTSDEFARLVSGSRGREEQRKTPSQSLSKRLAVDLESQLTSAGHRVSSEVRFHKTKRWRFDLLVNESIAVEIEGGLFKRGGGRHNRGAGMRNDMIKYNEAVIAGYRVIRVMPEWVRNGVALNVILRTIDSPHVKG